MIFLLLVLFKVFCLKETCKFPPLAKTAFCNNTLSYDERIDYLLTRLTSSEKIAQLGNTAPSIDHLNISAYEWWEEALHGVAFSPGAHFDGPAKHVSSFPQVTNTGRTFDTDLFLKIGTAISDEARAMNNLNLGYLSFWAPNINIYRDPRWGRGQETPGEDPYLSGQYVINFIRGMQGEDNIYLKTNPTCKHFLVYNLEDYPGMDRYHFDAIVSDQDLHDTYLPAFKSCVTEGRVRQIMCSYNSVNGIPSCANDLFQNTVVREEWGFDGHIVSDCGAISAIFNDHKYKPSVEETCASALQSGCDLDCGSFYPKNLGSTLQKGLISEDDLDKALHRLFMNRMLEGEFDPWEEQPYRQIKADVINSQEHQDLALRAARESMVLLKNFNNVLPLDSSKKIAVIGPNSDASQTLQGNYIGPPPYIHTALDGIKKYASDVKYEKGCDVNSMDTSGFEAAQEAAQWADFTILVMGINGDIENEMKDRTDIKYPGVQLELIQSIKKVSKGPVILVVVSGGQLDISYSKENLDAIIWAGYPSQSGGDAIADVIFGKISPAGRMAYTLYPQSYLDLVPYPNVNMRSSGKYPGRTYRFYNGSTIYNFGDGMSYTSFDFVWKNEEEELIYELSKQKKDQKFEVTVTNVGKMESDCVVLAFISNLNVSDAPIKELFGFSRLLALKPGESRDVYFGMDEKVFKYFDKNGKKKILEGNYLIMIEGLKRTVKVVN